jgi:hypothetical protein
MSKDKELPTQKYLTECFYYNSQTNQIIWKRRPLNHFKNETTMQVFIHNHAGKVAGSKTGQVNIDGVSYAKKRIISKLLNDTDHPKWQNAYECKSRGVHIEKGKRINIYKAQITFKGKHYYIGRFATEQEAYEAFCKKEKELLHQLNESLGETD